MNIETALLAAADAIRAAKDAERVLVEYAILPSVAVTLTGLAFERARNAADLAINSYPAASLAEIPEAFLEAVDSAANRAAVAADAANNAL